MAKKIPRIIPCVCTTHTPIPIVSDDYGMPILLPRSYGNEKTLWSIACPMCGRGSLLTIQESSAYKAIIRWNKIMDSCYRIAGRAIEYEKDWKDDDPDERRERNKWIRDLPVGRFCIDAEKSSYE